ncbi:TIGR03013 family XrtA/PEP-CTERM system glycosyltransferase [Dokdonella fugitiva]|uniref:Sugar transferase (PEP-CTERM system associated)/exopolysaccharide biosynthesis polyprenyl glycosylphosphotransferase n=1 Tax=Dokdonella fugitiva TaxID=328517 RepID=A0A4R2IB01_9GAMM|nr:TIGR03013 family XrtA/PEP-CTERM system glycosyltransferase [Dokdonella fugitiva]TCO41276.1 sugar transferase (PEP-CTERM system associated)/exopolysaccharide biosynthesis polyprenyl glycosylphosphotransferase [Dokdonella fugitiva]
MLRALRRQSIRWLTLLVLLELASLTLGVQLAARLRYFADAPALAGFSENLWLRGLLFAVTIVLGMSALGLYQQHLRENWFGLFARQLVGFVLGVLGLITIYYLFPAVAIGRGVFAIAIVIGFAAVQGWRVLIARLVDVESLKRRVLVLGAGNNAATIPQRMRRRTDRRGFIILGFVRMGEEAVCVPEDRLLVVEGSLRAFAESLQVNEIVVGPDDRRGGLPMDELLDCKQAGIAVSNLASFFERELGIVKLSLVDPSWLVFSQGFDNSPLRHAIKRVFDVSIALLVLAFAWPFMLLVALAIRLESGPGQPILYRQDRVGEHGRVFALAKFRSMRTDAERDGVARWAKPGDDRVTRVGRFIRRARLDELPQLWNILRGDMSVIGPRPERPSIVDDLARQIRYYNLRHCVKPGLAGWAQLRYPYGASVEDAVEKLKYDLFYVKNHDLLFDLTILVQTVEVVLFGRGAR